MAKTKHQMKEKENHKYTSGLRGTKNSHTGTTPHTP